MNIIVKQELADILVKSSFLPGFIDGRMTTADNCIDGGVPYIFFLMIPRKGSGLKLQDALPEADVTLYLQECHLNQRRTEYGKAGD